MATSKGKRTASPAAKKSAAPAAHKPPRRTAGDTGAQVLFARACAKNYLQRLAEDPDDETLQLADCIERLHADPQSLQAFAQAVHAGVVAELSSMTPLAVNPLIDSHGSLEENVGRAQAFAAFLQTEAENYADNGQLSGESEGRALAHQVLADALEWIEQSAKAQRSTP